MPKLLLIAYVSVFLPFCHMLLSSYMGYQFTTGIWLFAIHLLKKCPPTHLPEERTFYFYEHSDEPKKAAKLNDITAWTTVMVVLYVWYRLNPDIFRTLYYSRAKNSLKKHFSLEYISKLCILSGVFSSFHVHIHTTWHNSVVCDWVRKIVAHKIPVWVHFISCWHLYAAFI